MPGLNNNTGTLTFYIVPRNAPFLRLLVIGPRAYAYLCSHAITRARNFHRRANYTRRATTKISLRGINIHVWPNDNTLYHMLNTHTCALSSSGGFYQPRYSYLLFSLFRCSSLAIELRPTPRESSNDETLDYYINNATNSVYRIPASHTHTHSFSLSFFTLHTLILSLFHSVLPDDSQGVNWNRYRNAAATNNDLASSLSDSRRLSLCVHGFRRGCRHSFSAGR